MANKKKQANNLKNTLINVQTKAQDLNKEILLASEELIEGTVATGEQWQNIMAKALKNGTTLFGKQQELALDTVETLIGQYQTGNVRFKKLLGINGLSFKSTAQKAKSIAVQAKDKTTASVEELIGDVFKKQNPVVKKKTKKANKKSVQATSIASETVVQTTAVIDDLFEENATVDTTKVAVKKTATKIKATSKVKAKKVKKSATNARVKRISASSKKTRPKIAGKEDLKIIEGIGPKIEELLQKAGILTYQALATTDVAVLKTILEKAGSRYKLHDPTTWGQQAELAAAGKWEVLNVWKNRLKGGKTTNKVSRIVVR